MITIIARNIIKHWSLGVTRVFAGCLFLICSSGVSEAGKPNITPAFSGSTLAEKLNQKLAGQNTTAKKTAKSVADVSIPDTLNQLENIRVKIKNHTGFRYKVSPAGTPSMIKAEDLTDATPTVNVKGAGKTATTSRDSSARDFLRSNRKALRLADPDSELELYKTTTDELGITRHRYQQRFNGIPVWGRELSVYENKSGAIHLFFGNYRPTSTIQDTIPTIPSNEAIQKVTTDLDIIPAKVTRQDAVLVLWHDENTHAEHLVWHVEVAADASIYWHYFVDAKDGTILNRYSGIMNGSAVSASGTDLRGNTRNFTAWQEQDGLYQMIDVTRPVDDGGIVSGKITVTDLQNNEVSKSILSDRGWDPAAVSIITNIYTVLDYFKSTHNLNGYSSSQQNIQVRINGSATSDGYPNNAFFDPQDYSINFGIGDGKESLNLADGLDVVAHEFTHGVVASTANLTYQNQSGALNESFADFFGAMVDRDDWTMGEDVYLPNRGVLRDMSNPHNSDGVLPAVMSEYYSGEGDNGGVHINSSIPNRAAWLVAEGLTIEGRGISIGKAKTEKIWYLALKNYLHPNDGFLEAKEALIQAAIDLYGDAAEAEAVRTAWDVVEVFEGMTGLSSSVIPTSTEALQGPDWLVTVSNGGIYLQTPSGTVGPINGVSARNTRPSVVVGNADTFIFYVDDVNYDLRTISISTFEDSLFDDSYYYWNIAIPPNGAKIAFTTKTQEPYIYVIDKKQLTETPYYLAFLTDGGTSIGNLLYADAISFDVTGRRIVFDAKSINSNDGVSTAYYNWSLGILDLDQGTITAPLPPQKQGIDLKNPVFATNNNYLIAFDRKDINNNEIVTYNLTAKPDNALGIVAAFGSTDLLYFSQLFFNGDDTAVIFKDPPVLGVSSIKSIPVTKTGDAWIGNQTAITTFSPSTGDYPFLFRNSERIIDSRISVSTAIVDFGTVTSGTSTKKTVTIQNSGNIDLTLRSIEFSNSGFSHNGTLGLLTRGSSMTIEITYLASLLGTKSALLTIYSNAESPNDRIVIPITVTVNMDIPATSYTVSSISGNGYTVNPATAQAVNSYQTTSFTVAATSGYAIASVTGCGGKLYGTTYITGAITADCTVSATAVAIGVSGTGETNGKTSQPTISDALKVLNSVVGITQLTSEERLRYDVAPLGSDGKPLGNGTLDGADVILIMRRCIGIGNWMW